MTSNGWRLSAQCSFCRQGSTVGLRALWQNEDAYAFLSNAPIVPGHTLIVPSRCVRSVDELESHELKAIFELRGALKPVLESVLKAEGFNYAWNEGSVAGQTVPHLHLHMVPRKTGDAGVLGYDPRQMFYRPGPRDSLPADELAGLAVRIRGAAMAELGAPFTCQADERSSPTR
jgi:diadenosine tetraphosphate (Ap4A) HIT family hydrolase